LPALWKGRGEAIFTLLIRIPKGVWVLGGVSMLLWNDDFQTVFWIALLLASPGAGILWQTHGAASTFWAGAIVCVVALCGMRLQR